MGVASVIVSYILVPCGSSLPFSIATVTVPLPPLQSLLPLPHLVAKWRKVGIHFNFDPTGYTIDLIEEHRGSDPRHAVPI